MTPRASAIVRCRDEASTVGRTLRTLTAQSVRPEIIVVDSGSTDGSLVHAERFADKVIRIRPEEFSFGRALNIGAEAAAAPVHLALSAHCFAPRDWVERSLAHYESPDVAATNGIQTFADGTPVKEPFRQDAAHARSNPWWGFSNHASSWRADVWKRFPFDESLGSSEDREWALRVTAAGFTVVFDPSLWVDMSHHWATTGNLYTRMRLGALAIATFADVRPYRFQDLVHDWWRDIPDDRHSAATHRLLNVKRFAGLLGHYVGRRQAGVRR